jgi:nucleoid-associated protein YgaU
MTGFPAYMASVTAKYTLFTPAGTPVRAVCTVNLEEISGEQGGQNPTSGALAARDTHLLVAGDTLPSLAFQAYGDAGLWREIADANDIDDPMSLRPGARLLVPALEEIQHGQ